MAAVSFAAAPGVTGPGPQAVPLGAGPGAVRRPQLQGKKRGEEMSGGWSRSWAILIVVVDEQLMCDTLPADGYIVTSNSSCYWTCYWRLSWTAMRDATTKLGSEANKINPLESNALPEMVTCGRFTY